MSVCLLFRRRLDIDCGFGCRLVGIARGEQEYFDPNGIPTATEACKSNALMRCCKDLGIASELWDPRFIREFKTEHCLEVFAEDTRTKKKYVMLRVHLCVAHVLPSGGSSGAGRISLRSSTPTRNDASRFLPEPDLLHMHAVPHHRPTYNHHSRCPRAPTREQLRIRKLSEAVHKKNRLLHRIRNTGQAQIVLGACMLVCIL